MIIILFESIYYVLKSEKLFKAAGIPYKLIPTPRELSSECGSAMEIEENEKSEIEIILEKHNIIANFAKI